MTGRKGISIVICLCVLIGVIALWGLGYASEGASANEAAHDGGKQVRELVYKAINFAIMLVILVVVIRKTAIKDFFAARREDIRKKLEELQAERDAAERRYKELEEKLKKFEKEKEEILEQFRKDGEAEKERIIAEGKERAEQILRQADLTIERELQAAKERAKQELVDSAAEKARAIITQEMTDKDQDRLVNEFMERVEKLH